jgi:hypothetical protein
MVDERLLDTDAVIEAVVVMVGVPVPLRVTLEDMLGDTVLDTLGDTDGLGEGEGVTPVTDVLMDTNAALYRVVPPAPPTKFTTLPVTNAPALSSTKSTCSAPGTPAKLGTGTNRMDKDAATSRQVDIEVLVLMFTQLPPVVLVKYCQLPWAAVAPFVQTATPASAFALEPPGTWSVASLKQAPIRLETVAPGGFESP